MDTEFISFAIETVNGEFRSGLIATETDTTITLREAEGYETTFQKDQIEEMFSSGLSLMPEELEVGMEPQTMADLLAYLQEPR